MNEEEEERVTAGEALDAGTKMLGYLLVIIIVVVAAFGCLTALIAPLVP